MPCIKSDNQTAGSQRVQTSGSATKITGQHCKKWWNTMTSINLASKMDTNRKVWWGNHRTEQCCEADKCKRNGIKLTEYTTNITTLQHDKQASKLWKNSKQKQWKVNIQGMLNYAKTTGIIRNLTNVLSATTKNVTRAPSQKQTPTMAAGR